MHDHRSNGSHLQGRVELVDPLRRAPHRHVRAAGRLCIQSRVSGQRLCLSRNQDGGSCYRCRLKCFIADEMHNSIASACDIDMASRRHLHRYADHVPGRNGEQVCRHERRGREAGSPETSIHKKSDSLQDANYLLHSLICTGTAEALSDERRFSGPKGNLSPSWMSRA